MVATMYVPIDYFKINRKDSETKFSELLLEDFFSSQPLEE